MRALQFFLFCLFLFLLISMFSCSPARRLANIKKMHPKLFKSDTASKDLTKIIPGVKKDSAFPDTSRQVIIQNEKLIMKYFHTDSTIYLQGECLPDTVHYTERVITERITVQEEIPRWVWITFGVLALMILLLILRK